MQTRSPKNLIVVGAIIFVLSIVDALAVYFYLNNLTFAIISCLAGTSIGSRVMGKGYARLKAESK